MISNITQSPLRTYSRLPKSWPARPNLINYDKADASIHYVDGWRDYVEPGFDQLTQRLGDLVYDEAQDIVTRVVIDKTAEELEAERRAMVPMSITPTQGRILLERRGLLNTINQMIELSDDKALKIYYEYSLSWHRYHSHIQSLAAQLAMSETDLDEFFIEASQIQ